MNNPYTASFEQVRALYVEYYKRKTRERLDRWRQQLTKEQIEEQIAAQSGVMIDEINADIRAEGKRSETTELTLALQLADFYFPNAEKEVSFELRKDVDPGTITTLEQLLDSFEDHTHIDCEVRSGDRQISFQLKRYRGTGEPEAFVDWLNARVLRHYGPMNGTSLVVLMQIETDNEHPFAVDKLYKVFNEKALQNVSFDSVSIMYNDATSGHMALHELHPRHHRTLIELGLALARLRGDA